MSDKPQVHKMRIVSRTEEYCEFDCPKCNHRILYSFVTHMPRTLVLGDMNVTHTGATNGSTVYNSTPDVTQGNAGASYDGLNDPYLSPYEQWLKDNGM